MLRNAPISTRAFCCALLALCSGLVWAVPATLDDWPDIEPLGPDAHLVIIVVDGLRPDLIAEHAPTIARLAAEGAATLDARTVRPTATLPAITSMLTGLDPREHRVTWNDYEPDRGVVNATTIFDIAHAAGLRTALFSGKVKIRHAAKPESLDEMTAQFLPDASIAVLARLALIEDPPNLMLVHLPNVDRAGHEFGWRSDRQREALVAADAAIAYIIEVIESGGVGPTRVILTADHGGVNRSHYRILASNRRIPWILWGDGVAPAELDTVGVAITAAVALRSLGLDVPAAMELPDGDGSARPER